MTKTILVGGLLKQAAVVHSPVPFDALVDASKQGGYVFERGDKQANGLRFWQGTKDTPEGELMVTHYEKVKQS